MSESFKRVKGGLLAAGGFQASGTACGIKHAKGAKDLALLVSDRPATAGVTLTTNQVKAAPVRYCKRILDKRDKVHAIVVNSGNANACTGKQGDNDTESMSAEAARLIGCRPEEVLVSSTGIIGEFLPMEKVRKGIGRAFNALGSGPPAARRFAQAILTTDTRPKEVAVQVPHGSKVYHIGGCVKGAGMIGPRMATMLCYLTTDAGIEAGALRKCLHKAVARSFNCISVDGHASTNDTVALLASGVSGVRIRSAESLKQFQQALNEVALELAKEIVRDGEGATKLAHFTVKGARSKSDAGLIARAMASSPLNLTAIHGGDPNWGRFVSSAGYAGPELDEARVRLSINGRPAFTDGRPAETPAEELAAEMKQEEIHIVLDLCLGRAKAEMWACDLSKEYITINADYHT